MGNTTLAQVVDKPEAVAFQADFPDITPDELFDYFVIPDLLKKWWVPEAVVDARLGGEYRLSWPAMQWELHGEFTDFQPGERLGFTWKWKHLPNLPVRQVDIGFRREANGSSLRLAHGTYSNDPADQADRQSHIDGWNHFLSVLQEVIRADYV